MLAIILHFVVVALLGVVSHPALRPFQSYQFAEYSLRAELQCMHLLLEDMLNTNL